MQVFTGLEELTNQQKWQSTIKGNVAYLCHAASVDRNYQHGIFALQKIFGKRLVALMGPQHGFMSDLQDNMQESADLPLHPYFNIPVYSLYGDTRIPTAKMLKGVDTIIVDLQDVGCRVYTYINTMTILMEEAGKWDIDVVVLDRPNPIGGTIIEGNILESKFASFVGRHPIPMRHGMTIGEMANLAKLHFGSECNLTVIPMKNWKREMFFCQTKLPWVLPSPNLPTQQGALTFCGTVLFEGTNISEGRGTTRSLETIGHPAIEPYQMLSELAEYLKEAELLGFTLRPLNFVPTFQKHQNTLCGGLQIHPTDPHAFRPWATGQMVLKFLYHHLGSSFEWSTGPYEYEFDQLAIDLINGSDQIRHWVEQDGDYHRLKELEALGQNEFQKLRQDALIY